MESRVAQLERDVESLRGSMRRVRIGVVTLGLIAAALCGLGWAANRDPVQDEVRARKFVLVDDAGVVRAMLYQDPKDTQRRSRAAGLIVCDAKGDERGGLSTMDDGSVVFAMDAPRGVGHPMRDRIGLIVYPNGGSHVMLLDNQTRAVAKLASDGDGGGGPQVFKWDMEARQVHVKTLTYDGEKTETHATGGG